MEERAFEGHANHRTGSGRGDGQGDMEKENHQPYTRSQMTGKVRDRARRRRRINNHTGDIR